MPVNTQHKDYERNLKKWELVRDVVEGAQAVKSRTGSGSATGAGASLYTMEGTRYLPPPNPEDNTLENRNRYIAYRLRANFVNFTGNTKDGMLGMVFRKDMQSELPVQLEYMNKNATGGGLSLEQLARMAAGDTLDAGRFGVLVDYPDAPEGLTQAEVSALNLQASLLPYPSESIINWQCEVIAGVKYLTKVVLMETAKDYSDEFTYDEKKQYRVLRLTDGIYTQTIYDEDDNQVGDIVEPRKADGSMWNMIPFCFFGAENNDEQIDKAPLYDIAEVNISHYRNSADYEESSYMVGQPTPVIAGLTQSWVDEVMKDGVFLGSRRAILLPENGSASLLQADSNQMPERGMERKEAQMVMIGARLIQDSNGRQQETAEAAKIRFAGQNSKLGTLVSNVEDGLIKCVEWAGEFVGGIVSDIVIKLNREFYDATLDPQMVVAQMQLMDRGVIAKSDLQDTMRRAGFIDKDRSNEDIDGEAESTIMDDMGGDA